MNLTGLHLLMTYRCTYACEHCFVWSGPHAAAKVLTVGEIEEILRQAVDLGTVDTIWFEGGEPFLLRRTLLAGIARAHQRGFRAGVVSNGYWATSVATAKARLQPLMDAGMSTVALSLDSLHGDQMAQRRARHAVTAVQELGLSLLMLITEKPEHGRQYPCGDGGQVMFRGRAAVELADRVEHRAWRSFTTCPHEKLDDPSRVHVDPFGWVHLCQGIVMGNLFERPLTELVNEYDPPRHPIVGPLLAGGPAGLVERYELPHDEEYADACHLCYAARLQLRTRFPRLLAPGQMYGEAPDSGRTATVDNHKGAQLV